jgi:hypothetical protein
MKILVIGEAKSPEQREELDYLVEQCDKLLDGQVERRSSTSRAGVGTMEAYDILNTPAVLVVRDDGGVVAMWQHSLPLFSDVSYYYHS